MHRPTGLKTKKTVTGTILSSLRPASQGESVNGFDFHLTSGTARSLSPIEITDHILKSASTLQGAKPEHVHVHALQGKQPIHVHGHV